MKKNMLLSLLLILLGLGIFIFIDKNTVHISENTIKLSWSNTRKDLLTSIVIENHTENTSFSLQKNQSIWHLTQPINIPVKPEQSVLLINSFLILTPSQTLTNITPTLYSNYGLNKPQFTITGTIQNKTNGFIIGDKTSIGDQYYIADLNNTNDIYVVPLESIDVFIKGMSGVIDNYFFTESTDNITYISFRNNAKEHIILTNINSFWKKLKPEENISVDWGTRKFLLSAKDISFYPKSINLTFTEDELTTLGIDKKTSPMLLLTLTDGSQLELYIGLKTNQKNYPIFIAHKNILAYSSESIINSVFNTSSSDFVAK